MALRDLCSWSMLANPFQSPVWLAKVLVEQNRNWHWLSGRGSSTNPGSGSFFFVGGGGVGKGYKFTSKDETLEVLCSVQTYISLSMFSS